MSEATIRDLRNMGGEVLERVLAGEHITVPRDGRPVAELRPVPGGRLGAPALVERFRRLPPLDPELSRRDVDAAVGQSV